MNKKGVSPSSCQMVRIAVKTLTDNIHYIDIDPFLTVFDLKTILASQLDLAPHQQRLIFCGRMLFDNKRIVDCGLVNGCVVHLVIRLVGGRMASTKAVARTASTPCSVASTTSATTTVTGSNATPNDSHGDEVSLTVATLP